MKLKQLTLENFRGFKKLELAIDPQLTVLVGANGAGKSSVLDALAILLSWVVARVRRAGGSGRAISEMDIHNRAGHAVIKIEAADVNSFYWQLVKTRAGYARPPVTSFLDQLSEYAKTLQQDSYLGTDELGVGVLDESVLPVFVYYPVGRAVLDIPLRIRASPNEGMLKAWDGALTGTANFKHFFEWFRDEEDYENKERIFNQEYRSNELEAVRGALAAFLPGFTDFSVQRKPLRMTANKHGQEIRIEQLSDGEKCLIALVADLARRLIIANDPFLIAVLGERKPFLEGEGVVLIDEVDLHLHPGWQRMVLPKLMATFPNCQFIVSTHSPQILGEVEASQIRILTQDENNDIHCSIPQQAKGLTSNEVLDELMNIPDGLETLSRNAGVEKQLDTLFRLIDDEQFEQAKIEITRMKTELHGDIPDIVRAEALMTMLGAESEDEAA
jgi:predicted ATP-binding protein involved in virulence